MEDTAQKIRMIEEKLAVDAEELTFIKDNLHKSQHMSQNMVMILTSFENRLRQLEETILPVHRETVTLQKLQENIESTLTSFDHILSYHDAVRELENTIKEGPGGNYEKYLSQMAQIQEALDFFAKNNPESPELSKATSIFNTGKELLQHEFRNILSRHSNPVPPITILDILGTDEELAQEDASLKQLPDDVIEELSEIAKWLLDKGHSTEFIEIYHSTRSATLRKSMEGLKDHLNSKSGGTGPGGSYSPMVIGGKLHKGKEQPIKRANHLLRSGGKGKVSSQMLGHRRTGSNVSETMTPKDEQLDPETACYLFRVSSLIRLMQSESQLMTTIIPDEHQKKTFDRIIEKPLDTILHDGEQIISAAKRAIAKHEYSAILGIFPVLKHLLSVKPDFDEALQGTAPSTRNKLPSLITSLESTGSKALEEFFDIIKNDPDKSNMPKDGTVHGLTSNALIFLDNLLDFVETAAAMLATQKDPTLQMRSADPKAKQRRVATYVGKVLGALSLNLDQKAKTYSDQYLGALFLLNNYHYILKSLQRSGLLKLVVLSNPDIETHYEDIIKEQKREYSRSWNKVLAYILEVNKPVGTQRLAQDAAKLKDKERQQIKDKFKGFNTELEDLHRTQRAYAIPDIILRDAVRRDNRDFIVPQYSQFRDKYFNANFTKNPEKYIKYTPDNVKDLLDKFFDL
ncbi:exocyst complex component 7 isoform X2 [Strongylocentrotus purpuratus]|uniref:Exocyst complex component 7 n=1 Tax=Strongylocentrotus purpuratus TaxID=7668 RepID=A0A7M7NQH1_STRPU|nr:exocyst complex component 7 isoform X2 [Strongylocentrotus purpuratus]XP_030840082.1 exocyst complex component 7 isoform X2 [Strongylocentrotus purpuratus]